MLIVDSILKLNSKYLSTKIEIFSIMKYMSLWIEAFISSLTVYSNMIYSVTSLTGDFDPIPHSSVRVLIFCVSTLASVFNSAM